MSDETNGRTGGGPGGRTVAVTGSASGIGAAVAASLRADGDTVIGVDLHDCDVVADLATPSGRTAAVDGVRRLSGGRLDGLVACAGVGPDKPVALIVELDYFGAVDLLDALVDDLAAGDRPAATVIASHSATITPVLPDQQADVASMTDAMLAGDRDAAVAAAASLPGYVVYGMAKRALIRAVRRRAPEFGARGVRVNAVAPGAVDTPLLAEIEADPLLGAAARALPVPVGRIGTPDDVAALVRFTLGADAGYLHGAVLVLDGGTDAIARPDDF